jgi:signal transduction histidine kinase
MNPGFVLIVDDDGISRYMLAQHVAQMGLRMAAVGNGREALALLRREKCDLVLLDVQMPEMDGHAVLEEMKADSQLREIPVVMVSGLDEIKNVVRCIERGAEDYLAKPFDPVLLRARIGACLEKKQLRDQEKTKTEELERTLEQLKRTQDQLVVSEKLASLGELTAGIAHEIRNPLNFVTNFAQLSGDLMDELRAELDAQKGRLDAAARDNVQELLTNLQMNVAKIEEHGRRADSIVSSMLMHSRGQPGQWQPTDLNALLDQYVKLAYHGLRARDASFTIHLDTDYDPGVGRVNVIPQDLSRVFLNIANNACYAAYARKHAEGDAFTPEVRAATRDLGDEVEIRIRDNGNGVPEPIRDQIFIPFFTTKPAGMGSGLGLSISYDIVVRQHGGEIRLESEEGKYAEFIVTLPREGGPIRGGA